MANYKVPKILLQSKLKRNSTNQAQYKIPKSKQNEEIQVIYKRLYNLIDRLENWLNKVRDLSCTSMKRFNSLKMSVLQSIMSYTNTSS